jgi:dynein heavy chain
MDEAHWNLFLKGPISFNKTDRLPNPDNKVFSDFSWESLLFTETLYNLNGLTKVVSEKLEIFKNYYENMNSFEEYSSHFDECKNYNKIKEDAFLKLILIKIFRPDKIPIFIKKYVQYCLGDYFIGIMSTGLQEVYQESDERTPIIFLLSKGADPTGAFLEFRNNFTFDTPEGRKNPDFINISLGQGQEIEAKRAILEEGVKNGTWILLQNCHLFVTWMAELASIVGSLASDEAEEEINKNFRLWLTSMPDPSFPVSILQNSLKITTEPPSGIKANLKKIYGDITQEKFRSNFSTEGVFSKLIFSLSLFHSVIQERKKFGAIGFNLRYDFNLADFETSLKLLRIYLEESEDIPWSPINYLVGEVNYGGRVTDDFDRITMMATLGKFLNEKIIEREKDENGDEIEDGNFLTYNYSQSGTYYSPCFSSLTDYQNYIDSLPIFDDPDLFGLHQNANIVYQIQESSRINNLLLNVMPKSESSGKSSNEILLETVNSLLFSKPEIINIRENRHKSHDKIYEKQYHLHYLLVS